MIPTLQTPVKEEPLYIYIARSDTTINLYSTHNNERGG